MIKNIEVHGLLSSKDPIRARLQPDLNIFTGRNGSGKTTLLKLLWYVISGNIEHAIKEVPFGKLIVTTDAFKISIAKSSQNQHTISVAKDGERRIFVDDFDEEVGEFSSAVDQANEYVGEIGSSLFFPTFRRIEGGFSLGSPASAIPTRISRPRADIEVALAALSQRLTVGRHSFVAAISTGDIVDLLMRNYTELSEQSNSLQKATSDDIIKKIKSYKRVSPSQSSSAADSVLDSIRTMIELLDDKRENIMQPLTAVRCLAERLFKHSGIRLNSRLSFGDAANAINSEMLSAGEKQMLSFICYNAFYRKATIFIDEPELSLHVDWQRQLFPTLLAQGTSNQFVIATHSPFIYSKYPEREIMMTADRGASEVEID